MSTIGVPHNSVISIASRINKQPVTMADVKDQSWGYWQGKNVRKKEF